MKQISGVENKNLMKSVRFNFNSDGDRYRTVYAGIPRYFKIHEGELPLWFLTQNFKKWKSVLSDNRVSVPKRVVVGSLSLKSLC
jgi:hypothetical protein